MYIDPSGNFPILITLLAILATGVIGGLINGASAAAAAEATGKNGDAACWGGFVNGFINGVGVGIGLATGSFWLGLLIAGGIGVAGGFAGNSVEQKMNGDKWNFESAFKSGLYSGGMNMLSYGLSYAFLGGTSKLPYGIKEAFEFGIDMAITNVIFGSIFCASELGWKVAWHYAKKFDEKQMKKCKASMAVMY